MPGHDHSLSAIIVAVIALLLLLLLLLLLHISPVNIHLLSFWKPTVVTLPWCPS